VSPPPEVKYAGPVRVVDGAIAKIIANDRRDALSRVSAAVALYAWACIHYRATKLSEAALWVGREVAEGEDEWLRSHPLMDLFREPSPDLDMAEVIYDTSVSMDTTGHALWVKMDDMGRRLRRIEPFNGNDIQVFAGEGYRYNTFSVSARQGSATLSRDRVVYFRCPHPNDPYEVLSPLEVALNWLDVGEDVRKRVQGHMKRAFVPGGMVGVDSFRDDDERKRMQEALSGWSAAGAQNGVPFLAEGDGVKYIPTANSLKDLLPTEALNRVEANVCLAFGVRPEVLGMLVGLENSPWSHMDKAIAQTYDGTIIPLWRKIEGAMTRQLLTPQERQAGVRVRFDTSKIRALQEDELQRAQIAATNQGWWTIDELRMYTGKEAVEGEEGAAFGRASAPAMPTSEPEGEEVPPEDEDEDGKGYRGEVETKTSAKDWEWLTFDVATKAAARTWEKAIADLLRGQGEEVQRLAKDLLRSHPDGTLVAASVIAFLDAVKEYVSGPAADALRAAALPLVSSTARQAVASVAAQVRLSFDVLQPGLDTFVEREAGFLAQVMGETTGKRVAEAVQAHLNDGGTVADLRKRLAELPEFTRRRAAMVARTETTRAWNGAQREQMAGYAMRTGRLAMKEWLSSRDDRVREEHAELDGTKIPIAEDFPNGLPAPGEPNCRCTMLYTFEEAP